ncbi:hypothetical protein LOCC1_G008139 [Lachnellula occidentalis]|uniref:Myb-like domain-containing protein n=1 Tax=Lachnellula occidentalis TaxID=215460 RepID=A0A8H8RET9_9HELO|nr:hypothetical protein LOCC1_G008139 [Lachnellula occidentalis]
MPKGERHRSVRTSGYYNLSPVSTPTNQYAAPMPIGSSRMPVQDTYYSSGPLTSNSMTQQQYQPQQTSSYAQGGPVQHPMASSQYVQLPVAPPPSIRPSSGAWNSTDDHTLMQARSQGMNWAPIQQAYFPNKTPNACRKRHERLMERRNADGWDGIKLENMAKCYMGMRKEIWQGLAEQTGEKWNVVEQKCMSQGLKNLQTASRAHARRERMLDTNAGMLSSGYGRDAHADDSGIGIEDLEAEYDAGSDRSTSAYGGQNGHYHSHSNGSVGDGRYMPHGQRLPSMDMGIDAIINGPSQGHGGHGHGR